MDWHGPFFVLSGQLPLSFPPIFQWTIPALDLFFIAPIHCLFLCVNISVNFSSFSSSVNHAGIKVRFCSGSALSSPFCPFLFVCDFVVFLFISALSESEAIMKVQCSATRDEGPGKCQPFLRQAMLSQTANCELFNVGRRVCREVEWVRKQLSRRPLGSHCGPP